MEGDADCLPDGRPDVLDEIGEEAYAVGIRGRDQKAEAVRSGHPAPTGEPLFHSILGPRLSPGLPLHVLRGIGAAALQRDDVVNHVSRTCASRRSR